MADITKTLRFMWRGGNVRRFHTRPTIQPDFVGHHSYNGACIVMVLRPGRDDLVVEFIKHDMSEGRWGDMPAPAKRALPDYPAGTFRDTFGKLEEAAMLEAGIPLKFPAPADVWLLKLADSMDGMRYCIQERRMGNQSISGCYENFDYYVRELLWGDAGSDYSQPQDHALQSYLIGEWNSVSGK